MLASTDLRSALPTLTTPTLVICGERDRITPPAASRALTQALVNSQSLTFARAAHTPFLTQPTAVADAVRDFVRAAPLQKGAA